MPNLFRAASAYRWYPDADNVNAPDGVLLRADNTVPDVSGARALRAGCQLVYTLQDLTVHSLYGVELGGVGHVDLLAGAGDWVYINGDRKGLTPFDGSGDIHFGDDAYQAFCARGTVAKKWDGTNFNNWGIAAPSLPPTLNASNVPTTTVANFDSTESPAFVINEGTSAFVTGFSGAANGALKLIPDSGTGRASASKKFSSDQNYGDIGGASGGNTDLFDFRIWFKDWRKVDKVTVMFGLGTGSDPYADDYYYFDWNIRQQDTVNIKDAPSNVATAYKVASNKALSVLSPQDVTNIQQPDKAAEVLRRLGRFAGPRSTERRDSQEASPAWSHLTVTKGQFNRVGGTAGRGWSTVRAFKVVYTTIPGATAEVYLDDAVWTGGGSLALTGTFTVGYRFARKFNMGNINDEVYYELSPMSPISAELTLNQQAISITIPSQALSAKDPQVDQIWAYIRGGWLPTYYRFAVLPAVVQMGLTIDELTAPAGGDFDTPEDRTRLTTHGFTKITGGGAGSSDLVFTGGVSELEILIDNEPYTAGTIGPPANIVAITGPWNGRIFVLDDQGWCYPSDADNPACFSVYHAIDLRKYGRPLWLATTSGGVVAGFTDDVIRLSGTGDESDDHVTIDLWGDPMNVGNPPVDNSLLKNGNTIVYRSADGFMSLSSSALTPIPFAGTALLWRGQNRYSIGGLNHDGRFRLEVDNNIMYAIVTEGNPVEPTAIWRYNFEGSPPQWSRFTYPFTTMSIFREPGSAGRLLVGTNTGQIVEIEVGTQDLGADIAVDILTPFDYGGNPLQRKDAVDLQLHVQTGGKSGSAAFFKDGAATAALTQAFATTGATPGVFRADIRNFGVFLNAALQITGSFSNFILRAFNITHQPRPQRAVATDLGFMIPPNGGDFAWIVEAKIDIDSPEDVNLLVYKQGVLWTTVLVPVTTPGVRNVYPIALPHGTKGRRLQLQVASLTSAGDGDLGYELYGIAVRHRGSGGFTELTLGTGDAPQP